MKIGTDEKKKLITAGVLGFFAIGAAAFLYSELFGGATAPPPAPPVIVTAPSPLGGTRSAAVSVAAPAPSVGTKQAVKVGTSGAQLDPTLHEEAMLRTEGLVYTGTGRNIFAPGNEAPAPVLVAAKFSPRPTGPVVAPPPTRPAGPPPPPAIPLKFFGTATSADGTRRAFLLNGDDVFVALPGDVVQRRYRVVSIAQNSILIEDIPNTNKQTLPFVGP